MKKLTVNVGKTYEILIEKGIMQDCGSYIKKVSNAKKVCVITDSNVAPLYLEKVVSSLEEEGYEVSDPKGNLKYLTLASSEDTDEGTTDESQTEE